MQFDRFILRSFVEKIYSAQFFRRKIK